jgi:hypothetical protein
MGSRRRKRKGKKRRRRKKKRAKKQRILVKREAEIGVMIGRRANYKGDVMFSTFSLVLPLSTAFCESCLGVRFCSKALQLTVSFAYCKFIMHFHFLI